MKNIKIKVKRILVFMLVTVLTAPVALPLSQISVNAYSGSGEYYDPYVISSGVISDETMNINSSLDIYPKLSSEFYDPYLGEYGYDPIIEDVIISEPNYAYTTFDNFYGTFEGGQDCVTLYSNNLTGTITLTLLYYYYFDSYGYVYYKTYSRITISDPNASGSGGTSPDPVYPYDPWSGYGDQYYTSYVISNISMAKDEKTVIDLTEKIENAATGSVNPKIEYSIVDDKIAAISDITSDGLVATIIGQEGGSTSLTLTYTYDRGSYKDIYTCYVSVFVTDPKLSAKKAMINIYGKTINREYGFYTDTGIAITGISDSSVIDYKCKNKKIELSFYRDYNEEGTYKIYLCYKGKKKGTYNAKIFVDGKTLNLKIRFYELYFKYDPKSFDLASKGSDPNKKWDQYNTNLILEKGDSTTLKIVGKPEGTKAVWATSNKKVATVTKSGKVKAVGYGDADISVQVGSETIIYMVSVTTQTATKALRYAAKHYGDTYSQEKRMSEGYYDCSSYVWRSYNDAGKKLGNNGNWAPTAADLCKWCDEKGYVLNVKDYSDLRAGDLSFESGSDNGRYLGIYHVDMYWGHGCFVTVKGAKCCPYEPVFARPY